MSIVCAPDSRDQKIPGFSVALAKVRPWDEVDKIIYIFGSQNISVTLGYLHPGKCEHSGVQSHPPLCNGRWMVLVVMRMREYKP